MTIDESSLPLARVTLSICQDCLAGAGGECHTPGCAFWMNRAPDVALGLVFPGSADELSPADADWWRERLAAAHSQACDTDELPTSLAQAWHGLSGYHISQMAKLLARRELDR